MAKRLREPTYGTDVVALTYASERNVRRSAGIRVGGKVRGTNLYISELRAAGLNAETLRSKRDGGKVTQIVQGKEWVSVRVKLAKPPHYADGSAERSADYGYAWFSPNDLEVA